MSSRATGTEFVTAPHGSSKGAFALPVDGKATSLVLDGDQLLVVGTYEVLQIYRAMRLTIV